MDTADNGTRTMSDIKARIDEGAGNTKGFTVTASKRYPRLPFAVCFMEMRP